MFYTLPELMVLGVLAMEGIVRFGVSFERQLLERFDAAITGMGYQNRSEALRDLVRRMLLDRDVHKLSKNAGVIGTISFVYDHSVSDVVRRLLHLQHDHTSEIITSNHIHVDHDHCLEVLVVRGRFSEVRSLSERILALKGVMQGSLVVTEIKSAVHHH